MPPEQLKQWDGSQEKGVCTHPQSKEREGETPPPTTQGGRARKLSTPSQNFGVILQFQSDFIGSVHLQKFFGAVL